MITDLFILSIIGVCSLALFDFVGHFINHFLIGFESGTQKIQSIVNILIGSITFMAVYAIVSTQGRSIFILYILWLIYQRLVFKPKLKSKFKLGSLKWTYLLTLLTLVFFVQLVDLANNWIDQIHSDLLFYSKISEFLHLTGENKFHGYFNQNLEFTGMVPYHYFEFWYVNVLTRLTPYSGAVLLRFLIYPLFKALLIWSISTLVFSKQSSWVQDLFYSIITLLITLLPFDVLLNVFPSGWNGYMSFWLRPNLIFYLLFTIPVFILIGEKDWKRAFHFSLLLPIISITVAPSLFVLYGLLSLFLTIKIDRSYLLVLIEGIIMGGLILSIYAVFGSEFKLFEHPPFLELIQDQFKIVKAIVGVTFLLVMQVIIYSGVLYAIIHFARIKTQLLFMFSLASSAALIGVFIFQSAPLIDNTYQFPYFGYSLLAFVSVVSLLEVFKKLNSKFQIVAIFLVIGVIWLVSSDKYSLPKVGASDLSTFALEQFDYSKADVSFLNTVIQDDECLAFDLNEDLLRDVFLGKKRHFLTMQLGAEFGYVAQRICYFPIVHSGHLYAYPDQDYDKARSFNQALEFYRNEESHSSKLNDYFKSNNVRILLGSTEETNDFHYSYDYQERHKLNNGLILTIIE